MAMDTLNNNEDIKNGVASVGNFKDDGWCVVYVALDRGRALAFRGFADADTANAWMVRLGKRMAAYKFFVEEEKTVKTKTSGADGPVEIYNPVLVIEPIGEDDGDGHKAHRFHIPNAYPNPLAWGILLSDLLDHLTRAVYDLSGQDPKAVRALILDVLMNEDGAKAEDPDRVHNTGKTTFPLRH